MIHRLKTFNEYFQKIKSGEKTFEVRVNDRNFKIGDILELVEINVGGVMTGEEIKANVTYILNDPKYCLDGYVIMAIKLEE